MLGIMKKDLWFALQTPLLLCPLMTLYWVGSREFLDYQMAYSTGSFLLMFVANSILLLELNEDRCKGYAFLKILPIGTSDIVSGKFALVLMLDMVLVIYAFIMFASFPGRGDILTVGISLILVYAVIILIVAGLLYLGLFKFGLTRLMKVVLFSLPALCVIGPIVLEELFYAEVVDFDISKITPYLTTMNIVIFCMLGVVVYAALMRLAVRIFRTTGTDNR